jgi:RND superfamily putative drug exporter
MTMTTPDRDATIERIRTSRAAGPLGRLGLRVLDNARRTALVWVLVVVGLGAFAPQVESALSGAGWQDDGSESVAARELAQEHFGGSASSALQVVVTGDSVLTGRGGQVIAEATRILDADPRIADVVQPRPGMTVSRDGRTAVLLGGARTGTNEMVAAADDLKGRLTDLSGHGIQVEVTGSSALWSDFNESNLKAMLTSELLSWPVTMAILVLAFGTLVAAGLPLVLTLAGLVASAGSLVLITHVVPVSIWAMNFAMMFALALGIDYALFLVVRYRAARQHDDVRKAVAVTMDTAGKAILLSGATVLVSLSAVMLVPSPAFRSAAGGIMLAVVFVLGATLTLLPLVLAKLDRHLDRFALPWSSH